MLSDEEREALQYFNTETRTEEMHYGAVLVKLIEKQSKEIEELKEDKYGLEEEVQIQAKQLIEIDGNYISKEVSEQKERKAYIKGTNDADELCNKKWHDKIKAKIDEVCESTIEESNVDILYSLLEKE